MKTTKIYLIANVQIGVVEVTSEDYLLNTEHEATTNELFLEELVYDECKVKSIFNYADKESSLMLDEILEKYGIELIRDKDIELVAIVSNTD